MGKYRQYQKAKVVVNGGFFGQNLKTFAAKEQTYFDEFMFKVRPKDTSPPASFQCSLEIDGSVVYVKGYHNRPCNLAVYSGNGSSSTNIAYHIIENLLEFTNSKFAGSVFFNSALKTEHSSELCIKAKSLQDGADLVLSPECDAVDLTAVTKKRNGKIEIGNSDLCIQKQSDGYLKLRSCYTVESHFDLTDNKFKEVESSGCIHPEGGIAAAAIAATRAGFTAASTNRGYTGYEWRQDQYDWPAAFQVIERWVEE